MKLRLPTVNTWIAVWKEIGTDPVPIPLPELYASLKDGKAQASEGDLPQIASLQAERGANPLDHHQPPGADRRAPDQHGILHRLSKADQELVRQGHGPGLRPVQRKIKNDEKRLLVELQRKGMQVVIPDAESLREKGQPGGGAAVQDRVAGHHLGGRAGPIEQLSEQRSDCDRDSPCGSGILPRFRSRRDASPTGSCRLSQAEHTSRRRFRRNGS